MISKVTGCFLLGLCVLSTAVLADQGRSLNGIVSRMTSELNLTPEQVQKIRPIIKENILKRQAFYDEQAGEPITNNTKFKTVSRQLRKEMNAQLVKVLTPEQMNKLTEKQNIRESLNKDLVDFSDGISSGVGFGPQGGSFQF